MNETPAPRRATGGDADQPIQPPTKPPAGPIRVRANGALSTAAPADPVPDKVAAAPDAATTAETTAEAPSAAASPTAESFSGWLGSVGGRVVGFLRNGAAAIACLIG